MSAENTQSSGETAQNRILSESRLATAAELHAPKLRITTPDSLICQCCGAVLEVPVKAYRNVEVKPGIMQREERTMTDVEKHLARLAIATVKHDWETPLHELWCRECCLEFHTQKRMALGYN